MADAISVLMADHQRLLELVSSLTGGAGAPSADNPKERKATATRLVIEASKHEAIEEQWLWPEVRRRLAKGDDLVRTGIDQEQLAKRLLEEIDHMSAGNGDFASLVDRISAAIREHVSFEESNVFPKLQLHMEPHELEELGDRLEAARALAPTRPHPMTPPTPQALRTVGVVVATLDRARDLIAGRGRR